VGVGTPGVLMTSYLLLLNSLTFLHRREDLATDSAGPLLKHSETGELTRCAPPHF